MNFDMVLETLSKLCMAELDFLGKLLCPQKLEKWAKIRVFLDLKKDLVSSVYCVSAQMLYLGRILLLTCRSKYSCHSNCRIFKSTISPEQMDETTLFFTSWYNFTQIRRWLNIFGVNMVKMGVTSLMAGL